MLDNAAPGSAEGLFTLIIGNKRRASRRLLLLFSLAFALMEGRHAWGAESTAGIAAGNGHELGFGADYPAYLSGHDIVFLSPPVEGWEGFPLGNGDLGGMIWCTPSGLKLQINKTDAWDRPNQETGMLLRSCGQLTLDFNVPCHDWLYLDDFEARLSLYKARAEFSTTTPFMKLSLRSFVQVNRNVFVIRCRAESVGELAKDGTAIRIGLERWGSRAFGGWYGGIMAGAKHGLGDVAAAVNKNDLYVQESFNGLDFVMACRISAAHATALVANAHRAEFALEPKPVQEFTLMVAVVTSNESKDPHGAAVKLLDESDQQGLEAIQTEQERWWLDFWQKSFVHLGDDYIENLYYLQLYLMGSSSRGRYPVLFNGGLWTWNHDVRQWVNPHHWNMQQAYWSLNAANHPELMRPYLDTYWRLMPQAEAYAQKRGFKDCILWNEAHTYAGEMFDWQRPSFIHDWTPATQIGQYFWNYFLYTGDEVFLRERAYPLMKKAAEFYLQYLKWDEAKGEYYIYPASPYECESGNDFRNTTSDLAAIRSSFLACIRASERLGIDAAKRQQWQKVLDHLADYPLTTLADGTEAEATALDKDGKPAALPGYGFCCSTASVFPTGTVGIKDKGSRLYNAAAARVRTHRQFTYAISPVAVVAARLGMADEALKHLSFSIRQLQHFPQGLFYNIDHWDYLSRYAGKVEDGRMMEQRDYITDHASKYKQIGVAGAKRRIDAPTQPFVQCGLETLSILAEAVNEMLLQSWDQTIRVFPATPAEWPAAFTLRATGGFMVSSERERGGPAKYVLITSELGNECRLANPWPGQAVSLKQVAPARFDMKPVPDSSGAIVFATAKGGVYRICPANGARVEYSHFSGQSNQQPKHFGEAVLGKDRDF
jgi:alpha-L-fucosidase 2